MVPHKQGRAIALKQHYGGQISAEKQGYSLGHTVGACVFKHECIPDMKPWQGQAFD